MKKREPFLMIVIIALVLSFTQPAVAQQDNIILMGNVEVPAGGRIVVPLFIQNATNVAGIDLYLSYSPAVVTVTNLSVADFDDSFGAFPYFDLSNAENGWVRIGVAKVTGLSGNKVVANVELTAIGVGGSELDIRILLMTDDAGIGVVGTSERGLFVIAGEESRTLPIATAAPILTLVATPTAPPEVTVSPSFMETPAPAVATPQPTFTPTPTVAPAASPKVPGFVALLAIAALLALAYLVLRRKK